MSWNYRMVRDLDPKGIEVVEVREVYYAHGSNEPRSYTGHGDFMCESALGADFVVAHLRRELEAAMLALDQPILDARTDFKPALRAA